ncbi:MAG: AarF/ABC1/UbiB kinase family protein [Polyangia bacterium]|jgi:predicted unusual protein kinase regulating ubiquinone biosynthesis (AarF/ABC1/UbiB family)
MGTFLSNDPVAELTAKLRTQEGGGIPTSGMTRLRKGATTAARLGVDVMAGRLLGAGGGLAQLSPESLGRLVESLGELKGVAMKVGQLLSYLDPSLSPEARRMLSILQVMSQPTPFSRIVKIIADDLGLGARPLLAHLEREPVASASVGQVHRSCLGDGTRVAVKVRHPGADEAIAADFKTAAIGTLFARLVAPGLGLEEVLAEAKDRLLEECDYLLEARRQARFRDLYAGHPVITIPEVHPEACGARVLTTTWHDGLGLEAFLAAAPFQAERVRASRALYEFYVGALYRHRVFNADPHPGNLCFAADGRVTIFDHGCVCQLDQSLVAALLQLSRSVQADDTSGTQAALSAMGMLDPSRDFEITRTLLRGFYAPLLASGRQRVTPAHAISMAGLARMRKSLARIRLPGKLAFLFRIRIGLYAVLARLDARLDWRELEAELAGLP